MPTHKNLNTPLMFHFFALVGILIIALFETENILPLSWSMALFSFIVIWGLWKVTLSRFSLLTRTMIVLYALPFIHLFEYLWNENIIYNDVIWGLTANPYNQNLEIIKRLAMVGAIGAYGLVAGYLFAKISHNQNQQNSKVTSKTLIMPAFLVIAFIALFLSWINAPKETILTAAYSTSQNRLAGINFNAAWVLSYTFAALLLIDTFYENDVKIRRPKIIATIISFLIIVIWLQFMRGDRESVGLIIAFIVLWLLHNKDIKFNKKNIATAICVLILIFVSLQIVGDIRSTSWELHRIEIRPVNLVAGTWSASLLTPLSVVGDFYFGQMDLQWGKTYWDYTISLPPGVLTQLMGIERPIDGQGGPAWKMRYGIGGTNVTVVPFMDFGAFGVFFILMLYGLLIGFVETRIQLLSGIKPQLLYASFFISAPFWFWYGEMSLARGIMSFYLVWWIYLLLPKNKRIQTDSLIYRGK